jgi:haloacetate dehalogenase
MAQPPGLPEQLIGASADAFFGHFLDVFMAEEAPERIAAVLRQLLARGQQRTAG